MEFDEAFVGIEQFLKSIKVDINILVRHDIQGMLIKRLSNVNLLSMDKRDISLDRKRANQTHLDITGKERMDFFFSEQEQSIYNEGHDISQDILIELLSNNLEYMNEIDIPVKGDIFEKQGLRYIPIERNTKSEIAITYSRTKIISSAEIKKLGHGRRSPQVQINTPERSSGFNMLRKRTYKDDLLILLKYSSEKYMAIIIPNVPDNTTYIGKFNLKRKDANKVIVNDSYKENIYPEKVEIVSKVKEEVRHFGELKRKLEESGFEAEEVTRLVKTRVGQGQFRELLMVKYQNGCCICGIRNAKLLRASHIKSWADSNNQERIDENNGLLLCANHDALFDRYLISFNDDGTMIISKEILEEDRILLAIHQDREIMLNQEMVRYMKSHRIIFSK